MEDEAGISDGRLAATDPERIPTVRGLTIERDQARAELHAAFTDIDAARAQCNRLAADIVERDKEIATLAARCATITARATASEIRLAVAEAIAAERAVHIQYLLRSLTPPMPRPATDGDSTAD